MKKVAQDPAPSEMKIFSIYLIGNPKPIKIKAVKCVGFHKGKLRIEGAEEGKTRWEFFEHGVAAIEEASATPPKAEHGSPIY